MTAVNYRVILISRSTATVCTDASSLHRKHHSFHGHVPCMIALRRICTLFGPRERSSDLVVSSKVTDVLKIRPGAKHRPIDPRNLIIVRVEPKKKMNDRAADDCLCEFLQAGDSAGGGLALALLQVIRDEGLPMPAGAVLISPVSLVPRSIL